MEMTSALTEPLGNRERSHHGKEGALTSGDEELAVGEPDHLILNQRRGIGSPGLVHQLEVMTLTAVVATIEWTDTAKYLGISSISSRRKLVDIVLQMANIFLEDCGRNLLMVTHLHPHNISILSAPSLDEVLVVVQHFEVFMS